MSIFWIFIFFFITIVALCIRSYLIKSETPLIWVHFILSGLLGYIYFTEDVWLEVDSLGDRSIYWIILFFCIIISLCFDYTREICEFSRKKSAYSALACVNMIFTITIHFSMIFIMHEVNLPNSFSSVNTENYLSRAIDFYYFSLTTFTTVGFGDVTSITSFARVFVMIEIAVAFYLIVVVANFIIGINNSECENNNIVPTSTAKIKNKCRKIYLTVKGSIFMSENSGTNTVALKVEEIHKELDLIQACITRMANNSFFVKGWLVSIYAIVLTLMGENVNHLLISLILLAVNITFWWLDAFFLRAEKAYRNIYDWVLIERPLNNREFLYNLNPNKVRPNLEQIDSVEKVMRTTTLWKFYCITFIPTIAWFISNIIGKITEN